MKVVELSSAEPKPRPPWIHHAHMLLLRAAVVGVCVGSA